MTTITGYTARILWIDGDESLAWLSPSERDALTGDDRIAAATYTPYFPARQDGRVDGWLVDRPEFGPCIVFRFEAMRGYLEQGCKVTSLRTG